MAKTKISEFSSTPANNTDIDSINIAEGCAPSGINDAIRELMAQLKDFQTGAQGDSFNGPIGTSTAAAGAFTTLSATGAITSTLATGTAPLVIASTTKVANLNVDLLDGADWAAPAALGSTTPAAGSFTTLGASSTATLNTLVSSGATLTGGTINGMTIGATTASTGAFTTLSASSSVTLSGGTANGVAYLNGSKVVTSGSALTFDGTRLTSTTGKFGGGAASNSASLMVNNATNTATGIQLFQDGIESWIMGMPANSAGLAWSASGSEQMRLTSTGLGIGTSSPTNKLSVTGNANITGNTTLGDDSTDTVTVNGYMGVGGAGASSRSIAIASTALVGTSQFGIVNTPTFNSQATSAGYSYFARVQTEAASFTLPFAAAYIASTPTKGAGSTITALHGLYIDDQTQGTNNYGITSLVSSGTNKWNIYASGTANNYFAGNLGIGTTSPQARLEIGGSGQLFINQDQRLQWNIAGSTTIRADIRGTSGNAIVFGNRVGGTLTDTMTLDGSGNLGLGVTPSAWGSNYRALTIATGSGAISSRTDAYRLFASTNAYHDGTNWRYVASTFASLYAQDSSQHIFYTAPSGTAGNAITFTQAMTLDSSGRLGIGTTSPAVSLDVAGGSSADVISIRGRTSDNFGLLSFATSAGTKNAYIGSTDSTNLTFYTNGFTERARIDSSGNFLVGATSPLVNAGGRGNITVNGSTDAVLSFGIGGSTAGYLYQGPSTLIVNTQGARAITFENNGTERARIDSSGNLLVGATSQFGGADCKLQGKNGSSAQAVSFLWNATTTGDANFVAFGTEASVTQRGSITYNRAGGLTVYNTTSDYRAKDIYGPVTDSGALIDSVPVYMGKMHGATQERPMFIAHETPAYAHTGEKDAVDTDGNPVYQQMDASALIPVMWAEIQSLRKRLADAGL